MRNEELLRILASVPAKELQLLRLARELIDDEGVDAEKAVQRMQEIELASDEARAYSEATRRVIWHLQELARRYQF